MFFEDHEKKIYSPASRPDLQFDPLAVDRALTRHSGGRFSALLDDWRPVELGPDGLPLEGDISAQGLLDAAVGRAKAEEELVAIARKAFGLPDFPDCLDGAVLEILTDYLWWMEKKGQRDGSPPTS